MSIAATAVRMIRRHGAAMMLKRTGETDLTLKGKRIPGTLVETGGSAAQQRFDVKIETAELLASAWSSKAPRRSDRLTVDGRDRTVENAVPLLEGDTVVLYRLTVSG